MGTSAAIWSYPRCELATEGEFLAFERLDRAKSTKSLPLKIASQPLFAAFYCPERVPTKHLPPYPATNIIICTSIALPMAQLSTLYIYSCIGQERCVWFSGSGFVWSSIGSIHTLNKMKTYEKNKWTNRWNNIENIVELLYERFYTLDDIHLR